MNEHDNSERPSDRQDPKQNFSMRRAVWTVVVILCVAVIVAIWGIVPRLRARATLREQTNALAAPSVLVVRPTPGQPQQEVQLPGSLSAYTDAAIYARTNGYLQRWYFDIGAHVRKGQLLAVLSAPEVDQQLQQAQAELASGQANATVAQQNATRYRDLLKTDSVSRQETENFESQASATGSTVKALQANVQRLKELQSFQRIYAPFDGVITARNVDVGELVDSGVAKELFHLSAIQTLRVYVNVPQTYALGMKAKLPADLTLAEYPNRKFAAHLVRTSNAINTSSRTLLAEFDVDNRKGELIPGAFAQVHFKVKPDGPALMIPVSALIFRSEGLRVATVGEGNRVHLTAITTGEDDGKYVQITGGLDSNSGVVEDPPDSLVEGERVNVTDRQQSASPRLSAPPGAARPAGDAKR